MNIAGFRRPQQRTTQSQRQRDWYLVALLSSTAMAMGLIYASQRFVLSPINAARYVVLLPMLIAAYDRRGVAWTLALTAFFTSAFWPVVVEVWGTAAWPGIAGQLVFYTLFLGLFGFLAASLAGFLRARRMLAGAVQDSEALLARSSDVDDVVEFILRQVTAAYGAQSAVLLLRSPLNERWEAISAGETALLNAAPFDEGEAMTLARWLVEQGCPQIIEDLEHDSRFVMDDSGPGLHSLLARPMRRENGDLIAILVLLDGGGRSFSAEDLAFLTELTAAGERALEQAGRYARTDEALNRRLRQLNAIQRAAGALNATLDPYEIVHETLTCAMDICSGDAGLICVEVEGMTPVSRAWNVKVDAERIGELAEALRSLDNVLVQSMPEVQIAPTLLARAESSLLAPIRHHGLTLGFLTVESSRPRAFGAEAVRTVTTLADHAAVALENARLFHEISREKQKSEQIISTMADALLTVDENGKVVTFNPAAEKLTAWRAEEAMGHALCDVLGCQTSNACQDRCRLLGALRELRPAHDEQWVISQRGGEKRFVDLSVAGLPPLDDETGGMVVLMRDVTEKREMERFQREMIAAFSHELRTPLTNINAITELLLDVGGPINGQQREQLRLLEGQTRRLTDFADRFLDLSRLETGNLNLEPRPLPITFLVEEIARQWQSILPRRPIVVEAPDTPLWGWADEQAMHTILNTLIDNAAKYTPAGTAIRVTVSNGAANYVTITVCDEGPGIPAESQAKVFNRFYRVDSSDSQAVYGHGLGLYIAHNLVQAMGGQIWLESQAGRGSQFTFTMPCVREESLENPDR